MGRPREEKDLVWPPPDQGLITVVPFGQGAPLGEVGKLRPGFRRQLRGHDQVRDLDRGPLLDAEPVGAMAIHPRVADDLPKHTPARRATAPRRRQFYTVAAAALACLLVAAAAALRTWTTGTVENGTASAAVENSTTSATVEKGTTSAVVAQPRPVTAPAPIVARSLTNVSQLRPGTVATIGTTSRPLAAPDRVRVMIPTPAPTKPEKPKLQISRDARTAASTQSAPASRVQTEQAKVTGIVAAPAIAERESANPVAVIADVSELVPRAPSVEQPPPAKPPPAQPAPAQPVLHSAAAAPKAATEARPVAGGESQRAIAALLDAYRTAYQNLDARAVGELWPTVDERGLARAFAALREQDVEFDRCDYAVQAASAVATCAGRFSYVTAVGRPQERSEPRRWRFSLRRDSEQWTIDRVEVR